MPTRGENAGFPRKPVETPIDKRYPYVKLSATRHAVAYRVQRCVHR